MPFSPYAPLKIGFIGGATNSAVGYAHFAACRLDGHFKVEAGCFSRHAEHNDLTARAYGVSPKRTYSTWKELLEAESESLDAIAILTPTPSHAEIAVAVLDAGLPVICEKALATSSAECRAIEEAISRNNGYLAVTFNYSGYPMVRELRQRIAENRLGKIQQIHIEMPQEGFLRLNATPQAWRREDHNVPTVSLDLGVHVHHLIDFLTEGKKLVKLTADQTSYGQFNNIIDNVCCLCQYEDGIRVQAWWGKTALGHRNGLRVRVFGDQASAEWYQMVPEELQWADNDGNHTILDRSVPASKVAQEPRYNRFKAGHPSGFIEAFANLYADIAGEIRTRNEGTLAHSPFVFGADHAEDGLRMMETIHKAAASNTWVTG